eukprot:6690692-Lingulodinium_polyedra.AAC.1
MQRDGSDQQKSLTRPALRATSSLPSGTPISWKSNYLTSDDACTFGRCLSHRRTPRAPYSSHCTPAPATMCGRTLRQQWNH